MCIHVYGKLNSGRTPNCLFVFKVPALHGAAHAGNVAKAIAQCREMAPKMMGREALRHFNAVVCNISEVPKGAREALRNYLFCGDPNPDDTIEDEYVQFVLDLSSGQVCCIYIS